MNRNEIFKMVEVERIRQELKHPDWSTHWRDFLPILVEEVGETANAMNEQDKANLVDEVIQVMAVCSRFLENME